MARFEDIGDFMQFAEGETPEVAAYLGHGMKVWERWQEAWDWCRRHAGEDCSVLVRDWSPGYTSRLKYEHNSQCFFSKGTV